MKVTEVTEVNEVEGFIRLFGEQEKLDAFIEDRWGTVECEVEKKLNAYLVELGEFLNEVKAFKFWSAKKKDQGKVEEEYVDGIHFLLSIGNVMGYSRNTASLRNKLINRVDKNIKYVYNEDSELVKNRFVGDSLVLFQKSNDLLKGKEEYESYLIHYLDVGGVLGIDLSTLNLAYAEKNKTNYKRQENGY